MISNWRHGGFIIFLLSVAGVVLPLQASEYSQPGFYDVTHYRLDNGMRVILKPRHYTRNASVYLKVNIGHLNFPCGKRETAHFLEHLLFTGTTHHTEIELDELIESHGGSWNAQTANDYTLYYVDIFSRHLDVALQTLHEIITDTSIEDDDIKKTRRIVFREDGGKPSALRDWLYRRAIIRPAATLALNRIFPGIDYQCLNLDNTSSVTRQDILQAYRDYYQAANMTLVVVGDFSTPRIKELIGGSFGHMAQESPEPVKQRPLPGEFVPVDGIIEGRWHPVVGSDAAVYMMYRTAGTYSPGYYALTVLETYFRTELYNRLRVEQGMAYAPQAYTFLHQDYGAFVFESDSELGDARQHVESIKEIITQYQQGKLDQVRLDQVKQKILLGAARGFETNASFAEYYALNVEDLNRYGKYENYEDRIEAVSLRDISDIARKYFRDDRLVVAIVKPSLTYTAFYLLIFTVLVFLAFGGWWLVRKLKAHHRAQRTDDNRGP